MGVLWAQSSSPTTVEESINSIPVRCVYESTPGAAGMRDLGNDNSGKLFAELIQPYHGTSEHAVA